MHIHGNSMNANAANFYSVGDAEKAAAAARAADVRKRLLKGAASMEGAASPEETLLIGHWLDAQHSPLPSDDQSDGEYRSAASGKDSDLS